MSNMTEHVSQMACIQGYLPCWTAILCHFVHWALCCLKSKECLASTPARVRESCPRCTREGGRPVTIASWYQTLATDSKCSSQAPCRTLYAGGAMTDRHDVRPRERARPHFHIGILALASGKSKRTYVNYVQVNIRLESDVDTA